MSDRRKYMTIFLLAVSCLCYSLPYLSSSFYTQFLEAFQLTNTQAGLLLSMFSLTATPGYLFGGLLADKFSPKKLVALSSFLTAALGAVLIFMNSFTAMMICYLGFGLTTTFINWSAVMKLIRAQADSNSEGKVFGFFELSYAIIGAVTSYGILAVLQSLIDSVGFKGVIGIYAGILVVVGILIQLLVKDVKSGASSDDFDFRMVKKALAHPVTWINGFIVMGMFVLVTGVTYLSPYMISVFGFSAAIGSGFAIFHRTLARMVFSPLGGVLLDRWKTPKLLITVSAAMIAVLIVLLLLPQKPAMGTAALILMVILVMLLASGRSGMYTPIPEAGIPYEITGTAMGITSAIGYSTDLWLYTVCGRWIDVHGNDGYRYILMLFIAGLAVVIVSSYMLYRYKKNHLGEIRDEAA